VVYAAAEDVVAFAGGSVNGNWQIEYSTVDLLDTKTGEWTVEDMQEQRYNLTGIGAGNKLYFAGGGSKYIDIREVSLSATYDKYPDAKQLDVYPNPSSDGMITLQTEETITEAVVYDVLGNVVWQLHNKDLQDNQINISNLESANYLIKATTEAGSLYIMQVVLAK